MLARGATPWVAGAAVLALGGALGASLLGRPLLVLLVLPLAFLLQFFRDPDRAVGDDVVSPADGRVTEVADTGEGLRISVFMGPFDVHVNRAPLDAAVDAIEHRPGGHRPAFDKDAETNERLVWDLSTDHGPVRVVQIAGALVRRIVAYHDIGDRVEKGDRIGMIRFGSRVDVLLPEGAEALVEVGDRVTGAASPIARF